MKIKKVAIQGFRAFSDVEDATFDFMINPEKIANLISIYAPNGFGKTSFYDAVEWGITNQISRFDRMSDFKKIKKDNKIGGKQDILKNVDSKTGMVNIDTTLKSFVRNINNKKEYNPAGEPDNKYFKEVVLSQDLIDAFIKEEKAEDRYAKFVEQNPLISNYNTGYKNLVKICDFNKQYIKDVEVEIGKIKKNQLSFDFEQENKKVEEINNSIQSLKTFIKELELINKDSFSQSKLEVLTSIVKSRLISYTNSSEKTIKKIQNINNVLINTGSESVAAYIENRERLFQLGNESQSLQKILAAFIKRLDITQSNRELKLTIQSTIEDIEKLQKQKNKYAEYKSVVDNSDNLSKQYSESQTAKDKLEQDILDLTIELQNNDVQVQYLRKQISENNTILESVPANVEALEKSRKDIEEAKNETVTISQRKISINGELDNLQRQLKLYDYYRGLVEKDIELLLDVQIFKDHQHTIKKCIEIDVKSSDSLGKLENLQKKISIQNALNEDIHAFLAQGVKLISESEDCKCPLCLSEFKTQDELLLRVSENEIFGLVSKALLEQQIAIENELERNKINKSTLLKKLFDFIDGLISEQKVRIKNMTKDLEKENLANEQLETILFKYESDLAVLMNYFGGLTADDFIASTADRIKDFGEQVISLLQAIEKKNEDIGKLKIRLDSQILERNTLQDSLDKLRQNEAYLEVLRFFKNELNISTPSIEILDNEITQKEQIIDLHKKALEANNSLEKENDEILKENLLSQEQVETNLKELDERIMSLERMLFSFEQYLLSEFQIHTKDVADEQVITMLNTMQTEEAAKLKSIEITIENLNIINSLKDDCLKITEYEKLSNDIAGMQKEVNISKKLQVKLEKEKENLVRYLKETIDGFFYKDLINALYRKIDPHPDYEEIEFECTFEDLKPRLQIYTVKFSNGKKERTVPALYFSTAQINILSLSIFLARALKAYNHDDNSPLDCIFIDDPIQSMDSINILSFIDVFRGLMVNHNKQLIVSTHEENFHNLLQRKIPINYFDSKYFEFETFGKLKSN